VQVAGHHALRLVLEELVHDSSLHTSRSVAKMPLVRELNRLHAARHGGHTLPYENGSLGSTPQPPRRTCGPTRTSGSRAFTLERVETHPMGLRDSLFVQANPNFRCFGCLFLARYTNHATAITQVQGCN